MSILPFEPQPKIMIDYKYIADVEEFKKLSDKANIFIQTNAFDDDTFFSILDLYKSIIEIKKIKKEMLSSSMHGYYELANSLIEISNILIIQIVHEHRPEYEDFMKRNGFECGE